ncbi:Maf family protein [Marinibactrum halimedae]|uniref:7-methyl-GTP pyrophosphatase n=1 Tax=Marinibactrum halimedae TaxID=1444977 RepID=A0AA37T6C3_9GAMM|nr:nucleoside triphosphate pyrophosphatase [Marinibactrum halimedae]MCD9460113.1 Maf family nucleotide pyrophosphatase [Marinibactrum halimedae]GLS26514.1 Maf-like protein YceF [Marinibactrum halimedae]
MCSPQKTDNQTHKLILASSSPYRAELLNRLGTPFTTQSPNIDETPQQDETPQALALRLSIEKAAVIAKANPSSWVIGSDQVAELNGNILHKPGNIENARHQLKASSGKTVNFYTGLCLSHYEKGVTQHCIVPFSVNFLSLNNELIDSYLSKEKPFNCAGSFKIEGLGITLFHSMKGDDYTSLIGLPMMALCKLLRNVGIEPLSM